MKSLNLRPPATIEDLMVVTGYGKKTAGRLVREGKLPGTFHGRRYTCPAGEFDRYVDGVCEPKPQAEPIAPVGLVRRIENDDAI